MFRGLCFHPEIASESSFDCNYNLDLKNTFNSFSRTTDSATDMSRVFLSFRAKSK